MSLIKEFNIQLYSLRELTRNGFLGVFERIAEIGYTGVEFAGYGNLSASQMKELLDQYGLKSISSHVPLERLLKNREEEFAYNQHLGTKAIIVPCYDMKTVKEVETFSKQLSSIAKEVQSAGFTFGYHNHAHEFAIAKDSITWMDLLLQLTDPKEIALELDVYWAAYAGVDILSFMEEYKDRIRLMHLKQMADYESKACVDLDQGVLDFKSIIQKGLEIGIEHFILEQEEFAVSPYESIKKGYQHVMNL